MTQRESIQYQPFESKDIRPAMAHFTRQTGCVRYSMQRPIDDDVIANNPPVFERITRESGVVAVRDSLKIPYSAEIVPHWKENVRIRRNIAEFLSAELPNGTKGELTLEIVDANRTHGTDPEHDGIACMAQFHVTRDIEKNSFFRYKFFTDGELNPRNIDFSVNYPSGVDAFQRFDAVRKEFQNSWINFRLGELFTIHLRHDEDYMKKTNARALFDYFMKNKHGIWNYDHLTHKSTLRIPDPIDTEHILWNGNISYAHSPFFGDVHIKAQADTIQLVSDTATWSVPWNIPAPNMQDKKTVWDGENIAEIFDGLLHGFEQTIGNIDIAWPNVSYKHIDQ